MSPDCHAAAAARSVCGQEMRPDKSRRPGQEHKKKKKGKKKNHHYWDVVVIERGARATGERWRGVGGQPKEEEG